MWSVILTNRAAVTLIMNSPGRRGGNRRQGANIEQQKYKKMTPTRLESFSQLESYKLRQPHTQPSFVQQHSPLIQKLEARNDSKIGEYGVQDLWRQPRWKNRKKCWCRQGCSSRRRSAVSPAMLTPPKRPEILQISDWRLLPPLCCIKTTM